MSFVDMVARVLEDKIRIIGKDKLATDKAFNFQSIQNMGLYEIAVTKNNSQNEVFRFERED